MKPTFDGMQACCGVGCLIHGIATNEAMLIIAAVVATIGSPLEPMALAYICRTEPAGHDRAPLVAGFLAQTRLLTVLGKALYPLWDDMVHGLLGVSDLMLRYAD